MSDIEPTTCPRRMWDFGPWEHKENLDSWERHRWNRDIEAQRTINAQQVAQSEAEYGPGSLVLSENSQMWLWSWGPPRSCSFCGSVHPDDAIRLLREGWEYEQAKSDKLYLNPPGSRQKHEVLIAGLRDKGAGAVAPSVWLPVPPVKLYMQHASREQVSELNDTVKAKSDR